MSISNRGKIIIPPKHCDVTGPLIFLAGPVQGSERWQEKAIKIIHSIDSSVHIASPRRKIDKDRTFTDDMYNEQVDWETFYINRSAKNGAIIFWLAEEKLHDCSRSFAQTTRFEIGEWKVNHKISGCKISVGIEEGFTGERYIVRRFSQDCPKVVLSRNLRKTCLEALRLIKDS